MGGPRDGNPRSPIPVGFEGLRLWPSFWIVFQPDFNGSILDLDSYLSPTQDLLDLLLDRFQALVQRPLSAAFIPGGSWSFSALRTCPGRFFFAHALILSGGPSIPTPTSVPCRTFSIFFCFDFKVSVLERQRLLTIDFRMLHHGSKLKY